MAPPLRVLLVEDSADDALLVALQLERSGYAVESDRVETRAGLVEALVREWDVAIVDYSLPRFSGKKALGLLAEVRPELPAIVVSGAIDEVAAVEAMRCGARDFVTKQNMARLAAAVARELEEVEARRAQRATREALHQAEEMMRLVTGQLPVTIWTTSLDLEVTSVIGAPESLEVGLEGQGLVAHQRALAGKHGSYDVEDGGRIYRCDVRPLRDVAGDLVGCLGVRIDMTEERQAAEARHKLDEQLEQTQRLEVIGQLAGGVAHDFNNMLLIIRGYAAILQERLRGTVEESEAREIVEAADRAAGLTRQLLAFGRRQTLRPTVIDVNGVVRETESLLRRLLPEDVDVVVAPSSQPAVIRADVSQVEQVLVNLATNARDSMPAGGTITIGVETVAVDGGDPRTTPQIPAGSYVAIRVRDTGTGIDDAVLEHMFEPFFTTKPPGEGTGLGLPTVYGIVTQSGGGISVDTSTGTGSTFTVYLAAADEAVPDPVEDRDEPGVGDETVLLVEDDTQVRSLVMAILREQGYDVLVAGRPSAALALSAARRGEIDLLVTDVVMPEMSGYELAQALAREQPQLRSLFISGYARGLRAGDELAPGAVLLQKPFSAAQLARAVRQILDGAPPALVR